MNIALIVVGVVVGLFLLTVLRGAPYVPSRRRHIMQAFTTLHPIKRGDTVLDIGSGDGVVLRAAADCGARAVGYEINPVLVVISRLICWRRKNITVVMRDAWLGDFPPETTTVYVFSESRDIARVYKKVEQQATRLGRPLYLISLAFAVPGKRPVKHIEPYYLYKIIPLHHR